MTYLNYIGNLSKKKKKRKVILVTLVLHDDRKS
jgi:hypothetical protein